MKNINQDSQSNNEIPSTYQILNNIPEKQAIILQNTNKDYPIQLRVDPVTDYTALWLTVLASVLVSAITAFVTIYLVIRSNNKLIENQNKQHQELIENQQKMQKIEITTTNRKEWIKDTRILISEFLACSNNLIIYLIESTNQNWVALTNPNQKTIDERNAVNKKTIGNLGKLRETAMLIDLTLSKENTLDREIHLQIIEVFKDYEILANLVNTDFNNGVITGIINFKYLEKFSERNKIIRHNNVITEKTKQLLKNEWERIKNIE